MMKRFVSALLGSLAAIWLSVFLILILFILFIAALVSNSLQSQTISMQFKDNTILHIELNGTFVEREDNTDIFAQLYDSQNNKLPLNDILNSIKAAAKDKKIEGIFLDCKGSSGGLAQRYEIIKALKEFKDSGKWIVSYGDTYTQGDYYVASIADEIYLNPVGMIDIHGLSATTMFYKGLLDKLGVEMQIIKVGTYKSAVEPFINTQASEASKHQQQVFLDDIWQTISGSISEARDIDITHLNEMCDSMVMTYSPQYCVEAKLADGLLYRHEVEDCLKEKAGLDEDDDIRFITPGRYVQVADIPHANRNKNRIAVLYAVGDITDDGNGGIVATKMVPEILKLKEDDDNDGLILRVNSGGGSAFASEQIWEALEQYKETGRPFYVSMSDYAASGGYYISSGADRIYAEPVTLTGSIGIFGMIPCVKGLMSEHLGLTTDNVSTNANADFPTLMEPMTPFQRARMQSEINRGYETFVSRCAQGRHMSVDSIKAIAEGRVWDGRKALEIGLVDKLGTLDEAIAEMASELGFGHKYCIIEYPDPMSSMMELISKAQVRYKNSILEKELGSNYKLYRQVDYLRHASPLQCRMEYIELQ